MSWFSDPSSIGSPNYPDIFDQWSKSSFATNWGGGEWRGRVKTTLPSADQLPELPMPSDKNILSEAWKFSHDKIYSPAFLEEDAGFQKLWKNIQLTGQSAVDFLEYPERTWKQWKRLVLGNYGAPSSDDTSTASSASSSSSSGDGDGSTTTGGESGTAEEERARLDAIRRMLAGRYGRAETNLTGGSGYGTGQARGLGGTV